jgi:hypothetical protein
VPDYALRIGECHSKYLATKKLILIEPSSKRQKGHFRNLTQKDKNMDCYLIESNQAAADCHDVVEQFIIQSHIMNFEWGCQAGKHTAGAVFEAENESRALFSVPRHFG